MKFGARRVNSIFPQLIAIHAIATEKMEFTRLAPSLPWPHTYCAVKPVKPDHYQLFGI